METPLFASALSTEPEAEAAIDETIRGIRVGLGDRRPDLLAVFVSHHYATALETLGPRLASATGARVTIGCTGESIVGTTREVERGAALSVWAAVLPRTELRPFVAHASRRKEGAQLPPGTITAGDEDGIVFSSLPEIHAPSRAGMLLLADPYTFPTNDYLDVLNDRFPGVPVVGGMASGGSGPGQNLLITGEGIVDAGALGVVVEGEVEIVSVVSQGCRPVGKPWVITACTDNLIQKLGGRPAVQVLMETLNGIPEPDKALLQKHPSLGLAVDPTKSEFDRGDFLVRPLVGIEPKLGAMAVGDDSLRVGQTVQFLVRDAQSAGEDLVQLMREQAGSGPSSTGVATAPTQGALVFSCNGRGTRMFDKPNHDIQRIQQAFETAIPAAGFFAMGEIGPVGGRNFLHGFTASVAVFRSRR